MVEASEEEDSTIEEKNLILLTWCPRMVTEKALTEKRHPEQTLRHCFLKGGNSTYYGLITSNHFEEYEHLCKAIKVKVNH